MYQINLRETLDFPNVCPHRNDITDTLTLKNPKYESALKHSKNPEFAVRGIDPFVRFYNESLEGGVIKAPIGVYAQLREFCQTCPYKCPVIDQRTKGVRPDARRDIITPYTLRPSQQRVYDTVVNTIARTGSGLIQMPTGAGKTVTGFHMARESNLNTLFVTHTVDLAEQTADDYERLFGHAPGFIGDGRYDIDTHFTVAIIDSIYSKKKYKDWNALFGMIIFDEVHRLPTKKSFEALSNFSTKYKLGLTATLNRGDGLADVIQYGFGKVEHRVTIREVMEEGSLVPLKVFTEATNFVASIPENSIMKTSAGFKIVEKEAAMDAQRNIKIADKVAEKVYEGKTNLLVLNSLEQCKLQYDILKKDTNITPAIFTGELKREERREIRKAARDGEINALLTVQLAGMGLDIPRIEHLLMDRKISDALSVEQIAGRAVRACPSLGKTGAEVTDMYDQYCKPFAYQTKTRIDVYNKFREAG